MPGSLSHSPADIVAQLLIDQGLGTAVPEDEAPTEAWPVYVNMEPDHPDNCLTVYDVTGRNAGRSNYDGERLEHHGLNIRVRCANRATGYTKTRAVAVALDQDVYLELVTIGAFQYRLWAFTRTGDVIYAGREPNSQRSVYTINGVAPIRDVTAEALSLWVDEDGNHVVDEEGNEVLV